MTRTESLRNNSVLLFRDGNWEVAGFCGSMAAAPGCEESKKEIVGLDAQVEEEGGEQHNIGFLWGLEGGREG